ncbi:ATP-binding protein [Maricaulis sp.]|uniref:sensor histidine kinase n=1 Tax=Maricaulis sp. TaxID=1486257 RepID=UPI00262B3066|nr:ATP-binding protein [Maricaulis sp.]
MSQGQDNKDRSGGRPAERGLLRPDMLIGIIPVILAAGAVIALILPGLPADIRAVTSLAVVAVTGAGLGSALYLASRLTEVERARREASEHAEELARINEDLKVFASAASHDLQEPLRKVESFGGRLADRYADQLGDDGQLYLDRMIDAAGRMRHLIDSLLEFSRASQRDIKHERVDLNDVLEIVLDALSEQVKRSGAVITAVDLPSVYGDAGQIRIVLQNLLGNALKYQPAGQRPEITFSAGQAEHAGRAYAEISVADNGIGFDPKYSDRIFSMFERLHSRNEYSGAGIGLATCMKIVQRHKGTLRASSQPGQGATFTLGLPAQQ